MASKTRTGCTAGSLLNASLISWRSSSEVDPLVDGQLLAGTRRGLNERFQVPADIGESVVVLGEDQNAVRRPAPTGRRAASHRLEHVSLDVLEELLQLFIRRMAGPVGRGHHLVEQLHLPCEVRMLGVAQGGQRGPLGLAWLGFSGPGIFTGGKRVRYGRS